MSFENVVQHRRAVRKYDAEKPIDAEVVKHCLEVAALAPTSSNMQLWEAYHVTDRAVLKKLVPDCLGQQAVKTAQQVVVFVTRQDKYREHARAVLKHGLEDIKKNSPAEKQAHRMKLVDAYYAKLMPLVYARACGLLGLWRKTMAQCIGVFRPIQRQVSEADIRVSVHKSCALVAQTFMLAMSEQGLDTCPLEGIDTWRVKKVLNLPSKVEINMVISCGIRSENGVYNSRFRLPFSEMYHRV